jgi:predicted  nucleic acid-binding Zn-ribbon protein
MKTARLAVAAFGLLAIAACGRNNPDQLNNDEITATQNLDELSDQAANVANEAQALENQAAELNQQARSEDNAAADDENIQGM